MTMAVGTKHEPTFGERTITIARDGHDFDLRDHGIPVFQALVLSLAVGNDPVSGGERIYVALHSVPPVFLSIDAQTGATEQYTAVAGCTEPRNMIVAPDGRVLIVHCFGNLHIFDPCRRTLTPSAKMPFDRQYSGHRTAVLGSDGRIYLGGNGQAELLRFDLDTGVLEDLGALDPRGGMILHLAAGKDGFVYASNRVSVGASPTILAAYEPASGKSVSVLLPDEDAGGFHTLIRGADGAAYVRSAKGNAYRLDHARAIPIPADQCAAPAVATLAHGDVVRHSDMTPDKLQIGEGVRARQIELKYQTSGARIHHIAPGPGGTVYGSSIMPLYLFRYDPANGKLENLGRGAPACGEIYSFGVCNERLYYASYGGNGFLVYDPAQPWKIGSGYYDWHHNPRFISEMGAGHCRPRAMVVDSRKRVWVGSIPGPEYGGFDGGLFCYDTVIGKEQNNPVVIANHSIMALTADDAGETVFGGTEVIRGGAEATAPKDGVVFAWDAAAAKVKWSVAPVPGETGVVNLIWHRGKLYGTTRPKGHYFVADAATGTVDRVIPSPISDAAEQSMGLASDGNFYGTTWPSLFRWRPDGGVETLCVVWGDEVKHYGGAIFRGSSAIVGDRIYFFCHARLLSMRLPLEIDKQT